jgi:hypothetical protein
MLVVGDWCRGDFGRSYASVDLWMMLLNGAAVDRCGDGSYVWMLMELKDVKRYQTRRLTGIEQVTIAMTVDRKRYMN